MKSRAMIIDYMERVLRCLEEAELAINAVLSISGIEYPWARDVSLVF